MVNFGPQVLESHVLDWSIQIKAVSKTSESGRLVEIPNAASIQILTGECLQLWLDF